jgi:protein-S-isoprenylcysteine O-methyltransferase Ste14
MDRPESLSRRAFEGAAKFLLVLGALIFLSAWSIRYWQGWILWFVFSVAVIGITVYFLKRDPALIERRLQAGPGAEKESSQKTIQAVTSVLFLALIVFPGVDRRFAWSHLPPDVVLIGDALVAFGFLIIFFVFKENSYTSGIIEVGDGQKVITTGPYRVVRHPMYGGSLFLLFGIPLALGSVWGLLLALATALAIVWRLLDEEIYLSKNLPGYTEYCGKTRYRLLPGIY